MVSKIACILINCSAAIKIVSSLIESFRFNSNFRPLTFTKFCNCSSFGPQDQFLVKKNKKITRGPSLRVPRQCKLSQNWPWWPKLPHVQNLGRFCSFFLEGQNRNFGKVKGLKLLLSLSFT
jgi:hypothetical protein